MKNFSNMLTLVYHKTNSDSTPVRYAIIDGEPWFVGKDAATVCNYKDTWQAINKYVSPENKDYTLIQSHRLIIINFKGFKQLTSDPEVINWLEQFKHRNNPATKTVSLSDPKDLPTVFNHPQFGTIRTIEKDGEVWFVGKDVAEALGYSNPKNAVPMHVDAEDKLSTQIEYAGQKRTVTIINESGLYSLILSSKLPSAKDFKRWVTSEVLPSIRKTGGYVNSSQSDLFLDTYLPFADQNTRLLFKTTLDTIQQQNNTIQQQTQTISHQDDIIRNLTSDIPLADRRQILNRIVRFGGSPHTRWPFLYREFDNKFHMNTKVQLERYNETHRPKLRNRLDYIEHIGMFNELAEIASVIFGPDIEKLSAQFYEICK